MVKELLANRLTQTPKTAFAETRMVSAHRFALSGREKLAYTAALLAFHVTEIGLLSPNNSFKPSPLRGLGRDRAASGGPA